MAGPGVSGYKRPGMSTNVFWVAAVERLPPDASGFRRVLRLHAVQWRADGPTGRSACGYRFQDDDLRPDRQWNTVTVDARCALCASRLRRSTRSVIDLTTRESTSPSGEERRARPRLHVVPDASGSTEEGPGRDG
jgi:hypothetical protein